MIWSLLLSCGGQETSPNIPDVSPPEPVVNALPEAPVVAYSLPERQVRTPYPVGVETLAEARASLIAVVEQHARDPANPWAVTHAVLALGPDVLLQNGEPAVEWVFSEYAKEVSYREGALVGFPSKRGSIRIEPHRDLILKAFTEAGIKPDATVMVGGNRHIVGDLYKQSLHQTWSDGNTLSVGSYDNLPWTLQGLAAWAPVGLTWTAAGGRTMTLDDLVALAAEDLRRQTEFMHSARSAGEVFKKERQGIFAYTCGGAHLLQGVVYAAARGFGGEAVRKEVAGEVALLFWRYQVELQIIDDASQAYPEYETLLLEQRLKFLGHFLESTHKAAALEIYEPSADEQKILAEAADELTRTVARLEELGVLAKLAVLRRQNEQVYLDYVGDSAHAIRGIDLATGAGLVRY